MARIKPIQENELSPSVQVVLKRHIEGYNDRITNMKTTLAHSLVAFEVYMQWYLVYEQVEKILGKRLAYLFAYAISKSADCPLCTAYFGKVMVDAGENPEKLFLSPSQKDVFDFGAGIARYHGNINDHLYNRVAERYSKTEMVTLIAFAGKMIASNIFNNVAQTELDEYPGCNNRKNTFGN